MSEPVRETIKRSMTEARSESDGGAVGLVENVEDVPFQCATCDYFEDGFCQNEDPRLYGRDVEGRWCCNKYEHEGMRVIVE